MLARYVDTQATFLATNSLGWNGGKCNERHFMYLDFQKKFHSLDVRYAFSAVFLFGMAIVRLLLVHSNDYWGVTKQSNEVT